MGAWKNIDIEIDEAVKAERERIIKLLEAHRPRMEKYGDLLGCFCGAIQGLGSDQYGPHLIALIKGEQK